MPPKSAFHLFIFISASCAVVEKGTGVSRSTIGTTYCFYQVFVSALLTAKPFYLAPNGLFCTKTGFSFQITFHQVLKNVQQQKNSAAGSSYHCEVVGEVFEIPRRLQGNFLPQKQ